MLAEVLQTVYAAAFVAAATLLVAWAVLKAPPEPAAGLPIFELQLEDGRRPTLSAVLSGLLTIAVMVAALAALAFLARVAANLFTVAFLALSISAAWRIGTLLGVRDLVRAWQGDRVAMVVLGAGSLALGSVWAVFPSWVTTDVAFAAIAFLGTRSIGPQPVRFILVGFVMLIGLDVFGVWVTGWTVQFVQGLEVVRGAPIMLLVPSDPLTWNAKSLAALGVGDVMISGVMIASFARHGLERWAAAGVVLGLVAAFVAPVTWFPALLTLVPSVLLCVGIGHYLSRRRQRRERWAGWDRDSGRTARMPAAQERTRSAAQALRLLDELGGDAEPEIPAGAVYVRISQAAFRQLVAGRVVPVTGHVGGPALRAVDVRLTLDGLSFGALLMEIQQAMEAAGCETAYWHADEPERAGTQG